LARLPRALCAVRLHRQPGLQHQVVPHDERPALGVQARINAVRGLAAGPRERSGGRRLPIRPRHARHLRRRAEECVSRQARVLAEFLTPGLGLQSRVRFTPRAVDGRVRGAWHNRPMGSRWRLPAVALVMLAGLPLLVAACVSAPASPTVSVPFSQTDLTIGTGADVATGSTVNVDYTGWLYDASKPDHKGLMFDTSIGRTPFMFTIGSGQVIKGWDQGLPGMKVGGMRRLVIPPSLAYGNVRSGAIPANA